MNRIGILKNNKARKLKKETRNDFTENKKKIKYTSLRVSNKYTDKQWQEYFEFRTKCVNLRKTVLHLKTWQELKEESLIYLKRGHGIYIIKNNGKEFGYFFLSKMLNDKPDYKYISISHYLVEKVIDDDLLKLIMREYLKYQLDHGFLLISSLNGDYDSLIKKLDGEITLNSIEYELTKNNLRREVLEKWINPDQTKFQSFKMKFYENIPDDLIEEYCRIYSDLFLDLPINSIIYEPAFYAQNLKNELRKNNKCDHNTYRYLIFNEMNQIIAMTNVVIDLKQPKILQQQFTGVIKEYRRLGLAKWLKSAMYFKLENDFPQFEKIITSCHPDNQGSNALNLKMGYIRVGTTKEFKVTRDKAIAFVMV